MNNIQHLPFIAYQTLIFLYALTAPLQILSSDPDERNRGRHLANEHATAV